MLILSLFFLFSEWFLLLCLFWRKTFSANEGVRGVFLCTSFFFLVSSLCFSACSFLNLTPPKQFWPKAMSILAVENTTPVDAGAKTDGDKKARRQTMKKMSSFQTIWWLVSTENGRRRPKRIRVSTSIHSTSDRSVSSYMVYPTTFLAKTTDYSEFEKKKNDKANFWNTRLLSPLSVSFSPTSRMTCGPLFSLSYSIPQLLNLFCDIRRNN